MTRTEQTTVQVHVRVVVAVGCRLHCGDDLFVVGAAVIGNSLTGVREHEDHIVEAAEETVQDNPCAVN